jgi:hypothetical protein
MNVPASITPYSIDCPKCGRHYESTPDDDLSDVTEALEVTGYCCDICEQADVTN